VHRKKRRRHAGAGMVWVVFWFDEEPKKEKEKFKGAHKRNRPRKRIAHRGRRTQRRKILQKAIESNFS